MAAKILIVDDEQDLVENCVRVLRHRGYRCVSAYTGRQGIALLGQERPSLVLTDLSLPDIDGFSVLRHARAQSPTIPGVLMTAYSVPQTDREANDAGAVIVLPKPFSNAELIEVIERALR